MPCLLARVQALKGTVLQRRARESGQSTNPSQLNMCHRAFHIQAKRLVQSCSADERSREHGKSYSGSSLCGKLACLMKISRNRDWPKGLYFRLKRSKRWKVFLSACISNVSTFKSYLQHVQSFFSLSDDTVEACQTRLLHQTCHTSQTYSPCVESSTEEISSPFLGSTRNTCKISAEAHSSGVKRFDSFSQSEPRMSVFSKCATLKA